MIFRFFSLLAVGVVAAVLSVPAWAGAGGDLAASLPVALGLAFAGGLVLNLMPCVFPVLSLKAISLVQMQDKERSYARVHGLAYTAGVLLSFALLALVLLLLRVGGDAVGWGFQLQNPVIVLLLAYLLFVIGLNLSGVFEISGRFTDLGARLTHTAGVGGSFFTGVLATLVATPCTAPFMGTAMGYAMTRPVVEAVSVFLALGGGLAFPYLLLSFVPALQRLLPRPGAWMEVFRQFLAFPMFASAAWLVWVVDQQAGPDGVMVALSGLVLLGFSVWLLRHHPAHGVMRALVLLLALAAFSGALALAGGLSSSPDAAPASVQASQGGWEPFRPERLEVLLAGDDPIFVNMTAAWCLTCKVNERAALDVEATQALFREKGVRLVMGDWTNRDAEIAAYLKSFDRNGVPLYVYYGPRNAETHQRPDPVVLPQLLTPGVIAEALGQ